MRMLLYDVRGVYLQGGTEHEGVSRVIKWTDCSTANSDFEKKVKNTLFLPWYKNKEQVDKYAAQVRLKYPKHKVSFNQTRYILR